MMFSNFELYRDGWIDAECKRKHSRSVKGCLPCRKRKKKCTEERPVCQRCAKSDAYQCDYLSTSKQSTSSPSPSPSSARGRVSSSSSPPVSPLPRLTPSPGSVEDEISNLNLASSIKLSSTPRSVPWSVEGLPACSLTDLFFVFSPPAHALDIGRESSIITLTIPPTAQSPAVFHSMVSCSSIVLSQKQPAWQQVAIRHHCEALRSLATEMSSGSLSEPAVVASSMAVMIMLHLFERFDTSSQQLSCAHLLAAQDIFFKRLPIKPPKTILGSLVLEAFAFRIAINSPFHPKLHNGYKFMEALTSLYMSSPAMQSPEISSFRRSLWLELPGDIYDVLYKASCLLHMMPLDSGGRVKASMLSERLKSLQSNYLMDFMPGNKSTFPGVNSLVARVCRLYVLATQLILLRVLYRNMEEVASHAHELFTAAMTNLHQFHATAEPITPLLICPIAILGTAATRSQDRETLFSVLTEIQNLTGGREFDSIMCFLRDVWIEDVDILNGDARELKLMCAQLEIWLDRPKLSRLTL